MSKEAPIKQNIHWNLNPSFSNPLWDSWLFGKTTLSPYFNKDPIFEKITQSHRMSEVDWHPQDLFKEGFTCKWQGYEQLREENPNFLYCVPESDYADLNRKPRVYCKKNHWLIFLVVKEEDVLKIKEPRSRLEMLIALNVRFLSLRGQFGSFPGLKEDRIIID